MEEIGPQELPNRTGSEIRRLIGWDSHGETHTSFIFFYISTKITKKTILKANIQLIPSVGGRYIT